MTNHDEAKGYELKCKIIGKKQPIIFKYEDNDNVLLEAVVDKANLGKIIIPSFITGTIQSVITNIQKPSPFEHCRFTEIIIDNKPNIKFNADRMFMRLFSEHVKIRFTHPECIVSAKQMLAANMYLQSIDLHSFTGENLIDASRMFETCLNLRRLDLNSMQGDNLRYTNHMFCNCIKLKSISGLSSIDTSKAKSMEGMFKWCTSLLEVDLSGLNTSNIADLRYMFYDCSDIKHINLSDLDLSKVRRLNNAFEDCRVLVEVEFGSNKMESLEDTDSAFHNSGIEYINLGNWVTPKLVNMTDTFRSCKHLKSAILPKNTKSLEKISYLFNNCSSLEHIDLSSLHTNSIMHAKRVFAYCDSLEEINLSKFRVKNDCDITGMFNGCQRLKRLDIGNLIVNDDNTKVRKAYSLPSIIKKCNSLEEFVVPGYIIFIETLLSNLECCSNLKVLDLSYLSTKGIINDNIISRIISTLPKLNSIILPKYVDMELIKNIGNKFKQIEFTTN